MRIELCLRHNPRTGKGPDSSIDHLTDPDCFLQQLRVRSRTLILPPGRKIPRFPYVTLSPECLHSGPSPGPFQAVSPAASAGPINKPMTDAMRIVGVVTVTLRPWRDYLIVYPAFLASAGYPDHLGSLHAHAPFRCGEGVPSCLQMRGMLCVRTRHTAHSAILYYWQDFQSPAPRARAVAIKPAARTSIFSCNTHVRIFLQHDTCSVSSAPAEKDCIAYVLSGHVLVPS
ncbi:hypothetical protein CALCODRAFT_19421 [Calocera cornea HHB12733]|uniref:Uncharacterized protein n=1 Tax=Calocera cornea HHB12733 TaxID=1353952 RepID=A0A165E7L8_9BASI|nr:hypothetical protein CALCODRAFT_19421 [Calocera cornea HHB12733]